MQYIVVEHSENCTLLSKDSQTQFQSPQSQETFWSSQGWGEGLVHLCWGSFMEKVPARSFAKINIFTKSLEQLTIPPAHNYNFPIRKLPWKTHFGSIGMCFFNKAETFWFQPIFFTLLCNHSSSSDTEYTTRQKWQSHTEESNVLYRKRQPISFGVKYCSIWGGGIQKKTVVIAKLFP